MTQKVEYGPDDCMNKNGSSLRGYVTATYDNLVELFGEPNAYCGDKTWNAWDLCFTVHGMRMVKIPRTCMLIYTIGKNPVPMPPKVMRIGGTLVDSSKANTVPIGYLSDLLLGNGGSPVQYTFVRR